MLYYLQLFRIYRFAIDLAEKFWCILSKISEAMGVLRNGVDRIGFVMPEAELGNKLDTKNPIEAVIRMAAVVRPITLDDGFQ